MQSLHTTTIKGFRCPPSIPHLSWIWDRNQQIGFRTMRNIMGSKFWPKWHLVFLHLSMLIWRWGNQAKPGDLTKEASLWWGLSNFLWSQMPSCIGSCTRQLPVALPGGLVTAKMAAKENLTRHLFSSSPLLLKKICFVNVESDEPQTKSISTCKMKSWKAVEN